jgi:hypothetical protein
MSFYEVRFIKLVNSFGALVLLVARGYRITIKEEATLLPLKAKSSSTLRLVSVNFKIFNGLVTMPLHFWNQ